MGSRARSSQSVPAAGIIGRRSCAACGRTPHSTGNSSHASGFPRPRELLAQGCFPRDGFPLPRALLLTSGSSPRDLTESIKAPQKTQHPAFSPSPCARIKRISFWEMSLQAGAGDTRAVVLQKSKVKNLLYGSLINYFSFHVK